MPTVPLTIPTGKNNMLGSLLQYLQTYLPMAIPAMPYTINLEQYEEAADYPTISIEEIGMPGLGSYAFDSYPGKYIDENGVEQEFRGAKCQTMVEFNFQQSLEKSSAARSHVYQMFDQVDFLLRNTGEVDDAGNQILPPIPLLDLDQSPAGWTPCQIWCPTGRDSVMFPTYIGVDPERPGVKRLSLRVLINWMRQAAVDMVPVINNAGVLVSNNAGTFVTV